MSEIDADRRANADVRVLLDSGSHINADGHRPERATRAPVQCTATLGRSANTEQAPSASTERSSVNTGADHALLHLGTVGLAAAFPGSAPAKPGRASMTV